MTEEKPDLVLFNSLQRTYGEQTNLADSCIEFLYHLLITINRACLEMLTWLLYKFVLAVGPGSPLHKACKSQIVFQ